MLIERKEVDELKVSHQLVGEIRKRVSLGSIVATGAAVAASSGDTFSRQSGCLAISYYLAGWLSSSRRRSAASVSNIIRDCKSDPLQSVLPTARKRKGATRARSLPQSSTPGSYPIAAAVTFHHAFKLMSHCAQTPITVGNRIE